MIRLRDVLTVVATVLVIGAILWGLGFSRAITAHNELVQALAKQVQIQNDRLAEP